MKKWIITGFVATIIIAAVLPLYAFNEADRMTTAEANLLAESVHQGQIVYAENCVVCHGASGEGISAYPGLANTKGRLAWVQDLTGAEFEGLQAGQSLLAVVGR